MKHPGDILNKNFLYLYFKKIIKKNQEKKTQTKPNKQKINPPPKEPTKHAKPSM